MVAMCDCDSSFAFGRNCIGKSGTGLERPEQKADARKRKAYFYPMEKICGLAYRSRADNWMFWGLEDSSGDTKEWKRKILLLCCGDI